MKFEEITENEYSIFWNNHPLKNFLSSPKIAKLREKNNWHVTYVGLKNETEIIGCSMLLYRKTYFKKYEYYAIRGPLIDYTNDKLIDLFFKNLKDYLKNKNALFLRIDPYIIDYQRDLDGKKVENGIDNNIIIKSLIRIGFKKNNYGEQNSLLFSLDLEDKTEQQIYSEMKPNTRNTINKVLKSGINVRELGYNELDIFYDILKSTGNRKDFGIKNIHYYEEMYKLFHDTNEVKFLITELDLNEHKKLLENEKHKKQVELESLSDAKYNDGKRNNLLKEIESYNKKISIDDEIIEKNGKSIIQMSASMFVMIYPEIVYLSSGNYSEFMNYNSQYLLQWEMIKYGIENKFKKYNFYGIITYDDKKNKDYGVYEFKRGFNGYVEKLIGEYELSISIMHYPIKLLKRIKKIIKRS